MRTNSGVCFAVVMLGMVAGCGGGGDDASSGNDAGSESSPLSDGSSLDSTPPPGSDGATSFDGGGGLDGSPGVDATTGGEGGLGQDAAPPGDGSAASGVHTVGNQIYDGTKLIRLLGVDETGTQYACIQAGGGFFDPTTGGANSMTSITAMLAWGVNAVRIPLNEDCWLALNQTAATMPYSGTAYQTAIQTYVTQLVSNGIYPILDLHWTEGPGGSIATGQQPMPDAAHGGAFWTSVATMFKSQNKVIFDLFNEPYPDNNMDATSAWTCWGATTTSSCPGVTYETIGMAGMLAAVRATGATNLVLMGGIEYSNDLTQWLANAPTDTNIGVSWHVYNDNPYTMASDVTAILAKVPIVATEIGDIGVNGGSPACDGVFISSVMNILDNPGAGIPPQSYLAWSWSVDNMPALLSSYDPVTPTCDGPTYMTHIQAQSKLAP